MPDRSTYSKYSYLESLKSEVSSHGVGRNFVLFERKDPSAGLIKVSLSSLEPQKKIEEHFHRSKSESYFFIEGEGSIKLEEKEIFVGPGSFVYVPAMKRHELKNEGKADLIFILHHIIE